MPYAQITFADHRQNGFVAVAELGGFPDTDSVLRWVRAFSPHSLEPDDDAEFWFILDAYADPVNHIEEVGCLPTQIARRLAPEAVDRVLAERPDPDSVSGQVFARLRAPDLGGLGLS